MNDKASERQVELISPTAKRWLKRHRISLSSLHAECHSSMIGNPYVTRIRVDPIKLHPDYGFGRRDLLIRRGSRWLLRHRYKNYLYEDQGTGHAKLTVYGVTIPQVFCIALKDSLTPITQVVEIPKRCLASSVEGKIISVKCVENEVSLRFRIDWIELPDQ